MRKLYHLMPKFYWALLYSYTHYEYYKFWKKIILYKKSITFSIMQNYSHVTYHKLIPNHEEEDWEQKNHVHICRVEKT